MSGTVQSAFPTDITDCILIFNLSVCLIIGLWFCSEWQRTQKKIFPGLPVAKVAM